MNKHFFWRPALALLPLSASLLMTGAAQAQNQAPAPAAAEARPGASPDLPFSHERGFSYFIGVARQHAHYSEYAASLSVESAASSHSALLVTGALYAVHPDFLVALDNMATFASGNSTESWLATAGAVPFRNDSGQIVYLPVNGPLLQQNRFSLSQNTTRLLAHKRARGEWFAVGGARFHTQSFKRFAFRALQPDVLNEARSTVVEETASEILAEAGVALESERVKDAPQHYSLRATVATPLWRRVTNTGFPDLTFDSTKGWDVNLEGRYSLALNSMAHVGLWMQHSFAQRGQQVHGDYELPRSHLRTTAYGVELLWKL